MTMMPPRTKIDELNGGLAFRGTPPYVNPEAAGLVNPAQEQLETAFVQTGQGVNANAATRAAQMVANAKQLVQRGMLAEDPDALKGLSKLAANPGILGNTGYVLG
jgi:hypothetical protein